MWAMAMVAMPALFRETCQQKEKSTLADGRLRAGRSPAALPLPLRPPHERTHLQRRHGQGQGCRPAAPEAAPAAAARPRRARRARAPRPDQGLRPGCCAPLAAQCQAMPSTSPAQPVTEALCAHAPHPVQGLGLGCWPRRPVYCQVVSLTWASWAQMRQARAQDSPGLTDKQRAARGSPGSLAGPGAGRRHRRSLRRTRHRGCGLLPLSQARLKTEPARWADHPGSPPLCVQAWVPHCRSSPQGSLSQGCQGLPGLPSAPRQQPR